MSTAFVQTKFGGSATSLGPISVSVTGVGAGNHLMAESTQASTSANPAAAIKAPTSTPSATWSTGIAPFNDTNAVIGQGVYYSENVASGSWTVSFGTNSTSACQFGCIVNESSGVATSSSLGSTHTGSGTFNANLATGSITPAAGSILYAVGSSNGNRDTAGTIGDTNHTFTVEEIGGGGVGSSWSSTTQGYPASGSAHSDNVAATAANPSWAFPIASDCTAGIIEFIAATGGATGPFPLPRPWIARPWTRPVLAR